MPRLFACLLIVLCASPAFAQDSSALINEALDKQVKLNLDAPLPQAMRTITADTGVPIKASPDVYQLLPWGEQTNIKAKIENQTLRRALEAMTRKLGLTFELQLENVEIKPMPALRRIGRRATLPELQILDYLASTPFGASTDRVSIKNLLAAIDSKLENAKIDSKRPFAVENRFFDRDTIDRDIAVPRNATLLEALESITKATPATWYPWGETLVIVSKDEPIRNQLARTISVRFNGVDVAQVLTELSARAGIPFNIESGAIAKINPESRNVRLILDNASIQQALESISGVTGLSYSITDKGVNIGNPSSATASPREPSFGLLQLDNGMQVLVPQSQVPADLREYLKHKIVSQFDKIRQQMKEEGFKPATQPAATRPADEHL